MTDWIPSAVPGSLRWKEIVIHGIPQGKSADQILKQLCEQNDDAFQNCLLGACTWIGKGNQPGKRGALRIKLDNTRKANDLITNGIFLNYSHLKVSRFWKDGQNRG